MDEKKVPIIQDFSMDEATVGKYDFLEEHSVELNVMQGAHDTPRDEFVSRFLTFGIKGPDALSMDVKMVEKMRGAHIVINHFSPISTVAIEKVENLEAICILRSGAENVDLKATSRGGVKVNDASGRLAVVVSEFTVGMTRARTKNVTKAYVNMMKGIWENRYYNSEYATTLGKRNIGLTGHRTIGARTARIMASFDVNILIYDFYTPEDKIQEDEYEPVGLNGLCSRSDVTSTHYRLTLETESMIGGEQFGLMKPHAFLINPARAGLVDEECLIDVFKNHGIGGAALGVFHGESLGPGNPCLKMDSVILTPHIAGTAPNSDELTFDIMGHTLQHYLETGEWVHVVGQEKDERINERGIG